MIILQRPGLISLRMASVSPTYLDFIPVISSTSHLVLMSECLCWWSLLYAVIQLRHELLPPLIRFGKTCCIPEKELNGLQASMIMKCCLSFSPSVWSGFKALSLAWKKDHVGFLKVAITIHLQSVSEPSETFSGCVVHRHYSVHASRVHHCEPGILEFRLPCCYAISLLTLWWYSPLHHFPSQWHCGANVMIFKNRTTFWPSVGQGWSQAQRQSAAWLGMRSPWASPGLQAPAPESPHGGTPTWKSFWLSDILLT